MVLSVRQLISRHPDGFTITNYQRHYVWGQYREGNKDAVAYLTQCLLDAFAKDEPYFVQSITVAGSCLIDGQQRMTYFLLLTRYLGLKDGLRLKYDNREQAQQWIDKADMSDIGERIDEPSQDIYYFRRTLRTISCLVDSSAADHTALLDYVLDKVQLLYVSLQPTANPISIYKMMNGTKSAMDAADIIKAEVLRLASDSAQPYSYQWELEALRNRYADQWNGWVRWWLRDSVREYFSSLPENGIDLLLKLCLRNIDDDFSSPLTYSELYKYISAQDTESYHAAKHFFEKLRGAQSRIVGAYTDNESYNRLRAILLLQSRPHRYRLLYMYFIDASIDRAQLERYYKLSFLGMNVDEISSGLPINERFDDLMASLSAADVYHSDAKRDVFNLLLRLNIDEDIKLGRRFDFSVWNNRSLEHIYSKSKVWHTDASGKIFDGNDNPLPMSRAKIERDSTFMPREKIVNRDGTMLSEHCIGNLVLLYGQNNATFGNATFDEKKMMFLAPGDRTVFQSRNLLHTVCVFAGNVWDNNSIVNNYNQTLKNLKIYYGLN